MCAYNVENHLRELSLKGQSLISNTEARAQPEINATRAWLAIVSDTIKTLLPPDSSLLKEFERIYSDDMDKDNSDKVISQANRILEYVEDELQLRSINRQTIRYSDEEKQRLEQSLENVVSMKIVDKYFKSWKIYVPFAIFSAAAIFAVFGVIQIKNYSMNVQDVTEKAIERVRQNINTQESEIKKSIDNLAVSARNTISEEVTKHIRRLKAEKAPNAEKMLADIVYKLNKAEETLSNTIDNTRDLEERISVLKKIVDEAKIDRPSLREAAVAILKSWLAIIVGILTLCSLSVILSIIAIRKARRRP